MKYLLTFTICLLSLTNLCSQQDWAPIGAKWHYKLIYFFSPNIGVNVYESVGDTLINGHNCRIITRQDDACTGLGTPIYMYSDSNQVFLYHQQNDTFNLLYDFNKVAGESWDDTHVVETDTININGNDLKRMMVYYGDSTQFPVFDTIVERLGNTKRMFPFVIPICDATYNVGLRCYEDPTLGLISLVNIECDFTAVEDLNTPSIDIYPTLFSQNITLEIEENAFLQIISLSGEKQLEQNIPPGKNEINLSYLKKGIYFIQLFDNKQHPLIVKKIVKIE